MYPYSVVKITISNVEKWKIWLQFNQSLRNLFYGIIIADPLSYPPYYVCTYVPYGLVPLILVIHVHYSKYKRFYLGFICGYDYVHACTFIRNIWAHSSIHAHILSINICACACAHMIICACTDVRACAQINFLCTGHLYMHLQNLPWTWLCKHPCSYVHVSVCPCTGFCEHMCMCPREHMC